MNKGSERGRDARVALSEPSASQGHRVQRTPAWRAKRRMRYARLLRRMGLASEAIAHRLARRHMSGRGVHAVTTEAVAAWVHDVIPRDEEETFGVLAEYKQVRELRDRVYRSITGEDELGIDPAKARSLLQLYDKMLSWSLTLSGKGALLGVGRLGRRGVRGIIERMVRQLGDILRDLGVVDEAALVKHGDEITRRMLAAAPGWFEVTQEERE